ncbi:MAG: MarR family transcriptional regulator [Rhodospirillales bacterium]|nr:MarR family transcriptional regulator [Rhodospirillales bacterium]
MAGKHATPPQQPPAAEPRPTQADYEALAEFRYLVRCFLDFSQSEARAAGLTPRQHQALLQLKRLPAGSPPTIGALAERLRIRHHSAAELADRLAEAGLVARRPDPSDQRRVLLDLTALAERHLADLSAVHLDELHKMSGVLDTIVQLARRRAM